MGAHSSGRRSEAGGRVPRGRREGRGGLPAEGLVHAVGLRAPPAEVLVSAAAVTVAVGRVGGVRPGGGGGLLAQEPGHAPPGRRRGEQSVSFGLVPACDTESMDCGPRAAWAPARGAGRQALVVGAQVQTAAGQRRDSAQRAGGATQKSA